MSPGRTKNAFGRLRLDGRTDRESLADQMWRAVYLWITILSLRMERSVSRYTCVTKLTLGVISTFFDGL